jgi:DNA adenine methylase
MSEFMRPPLKWAGGKYPQLERIFQALGFDDGPRTAHYIEPFVGAGAVFLNLTGEAVIADMNETLIEFYRQVRDNGPAFIEFCHGFFHQSYNTREAFEMIRADFNNPNIGAQRKAAYLLYLNKHCFNGLYRVNNDGEFNVPFGEHKEVRFPMQQMLHLWRRLTGVLIHHNDFEITLEWAHSGSLVYCDPPYAPRSVTSDFTSYTSGGFPWSFHVKLEECVWRAAGRGARVVVSNADAPHVRSLYSRATRIISHNGRRSVSADGSKRSPAPEVLAIYEPR